MSLASKLFQILFVPEVTTPLKTLDLPLGGSSSPIDALAVLVDFLAVTNSKSANEIDAPSSYDDDEEGLTTVQALRASLRIANRMTGNTAESLGLHPAVYFTNDQGKHNRFLFLGMAAVITRKLRSNDSLWFKKFTLRRKEVEEFLIANKSAIGIVLQNLSKKQRIPKMRDMFEYLVSETNATQDLDPVSVFRHLALRGKIIDLTLTELGSSFTDDTKSRIFYKDAITRAAVCPICGGLLDPAKSVSYDHIQRVSEGGLGTAENGQMVHPYCNTGMKG